jgi:hypothetical protein
MQTDMQGNDTQTEVCKLIKLSGLFRAWQESPADGLRPEKTFHARQMFQVKSASSPGVDSSVDHE